MHYYTPKKKREPLRERVNYKDIALQNEYSDTNISPSEFNDKYINARSKPTNTMSKYNGLGLYVKNYKYSEVSDGDNDVSCRGYKEFYDDTYYNKNLIDSKYINDRNYNGQQEYMERSGDKKMESRNKRNQIIEREHFYNKQRDVQKHSKNTKNQIHKNKEFDDCAYDDVNKNNYRRNKYHSIIEDSDYQSQYYNDHKIYSKDKANKNDNIFVKENGFKNQTESQRNANFDRDNFKYRNTFGNNYKYKHKSDENVYNENEYTKKDESNFTKFNDQKHIINYRNQQNHNLKNKNNYKDDENETSSDQIIQNTAEELFNDLSLSPKKHKYEDEQIKTNNLITKNKPIEQIKTEIFNQEKENFERWKNEFMITKNAEFEEYKKKLLNSKENEIKKLNENFNVDKINLIETLKKQHENEILTKENILNNYKDKYKKNISKYKEICINKIQSEREENEKKLESAKSQYIEKLEKYKQCCSRLKEKYKKDILKKYADL